MPRRTCSGRGLRRRREHHSVLADRDLAVNVLLRVSEEGRQDEPRRSGGYDVIEGEHARLGLRGHPGRVLGGGMVARNVVGNLGSGGIRGIALDMVAGFQAKAAAQAAARRIAATSAAARGFGFFPGFIFRQLCWSGASSVSGPLPPRRSGSGRSRAGRPSRRGRRRYP